MLLRSLLASLLAVCFTVLNVHVVCGQAYPHKPIRIVTTPLGGGADFAARLIAPAISVSVGQPVIVDNRATNTLGELISNAPPDGHTLVVQGAPLWVGTLLRKVPYDPLKDFAPISLVAILPLVLYTSLSLPVQSVKELIALAKARPGELNNSRGGSGGAAHLAGELFKTMAGVKIVDVPYTSQSQELADLVSGRVQLTFTGPAALMEQVKAGRLKALAVTSVQRSSLLPGLPTVAETLPGFEASQIVAILAPGKTPPAVVKRLNQEVVRILNIAEVKEKFFNSGVEAVSSSPEELLARIKNDLANLGKVIKDAGIKVE